MTREDLERASTLLSEAGELADGDLRDRLETHSDQLAALAEADRDPDHGRLDRHMNALYEIMQDTDGDLHDRVSAARSAVSEFRKTVEGV